MPCGLSARILCCRRRTRTANLGQYVGRILQVTALCQLSYTAYRYRVLNYSHRIKPVLVAGREAHIHLLFVSVVRSSTSGPLVASDTDSSPAPSSQPSSLQFVAVGIRRPRRQSYIVFHSVKEPLSFHYLWKVAESNRLLIRGFSGNHQRCAPTVPLFHLPVCPIVSGFFLPLSQ